MPDASLEPHCQQGRARIGLQSLVSGSIVIDASFRRGHLIQPR